MSTTPISATVETFPGEYEVLVYEVVDEMDEPVTDLPVTGWRLDVRPYQGAPLVAAWASEPASGEGTITALGAVVTASGLPAPMQPGAYRYTLTCAGEDGAVRHHLDGAFIVHPSTLY